MRQVQVLGTDGTKYRTSDGLKTAIGNAEHRVGSMAWCNGEFLLGGQQYSSRVPYVPADKSECILELIASETENGVGYVALLEIKNDKITEIRREKLKFSLVDDIQTERYPYFVYNADSMFFVGVVGGMDYYKKIDSSGVKDFDFKSDYSISNLCSLKITDKGGLECITSQCAGDRWWDERAQWYVFYNLRNNIVKFKDGVFSQENKQIPVDFGEYRIEVDSAYDVYNKKSITYLTALDNGRLLPDADNVKFDIIKGVSSSVKGDYQQYDIHTIGSKYDIDIGLNDEYTLNKEITFINSYSKTSVKYSINSKDGLKKIVFSDSDSIASEQQDLFKNPLTMPTLNIGKKYMLLTTSYPTTYYLSRKRFLIDLKKNKMIWEDERKTDKANVNSQIITKKQAEKLLDLLKNMEV